MLTVWGRKTSSNVQSLMWCLGELDLEYERHDIGHHFGGTDSAEFFALNPNRTIPVIRDGTNPPLWESGCILRYLANTYAKDSFWPVDPLRRAEVDQWAEWSKLNVASEFTVPIFWRVVRTPEPERDHAAIDKAVLFLEKKLGIANTLLEQQSYLVGNSFTLADIQFGHVLFRYFDIEINRAPLLALSEYHKRLKARNAYREHVMISYDELRLS
jgi:glutathione S-transferase